MATPTRSAATDDRQGGGRRRRRLGTLVALCTVISACVVALAPAPAQAATNPLWQCPFPQQHLPLDPNYVGYVKQFALVSSQPTFDVAESRVVINDTDTVASATFTTQRSQTFTLQVSVGASASGLLDFLTVNVSASIVLSRTTAVGVSTTGQVPPHSRLIGEYGIQAFDVTYDVVTYQILAHVACKSVGSERFTTNAPTALEGWRIRTG